MKPKLIDVGLSGTRTVKIKKINQFRLDSPFHFHHLCELVWIEQSQGTRIIGDNIGSFKDGDLILMAPNLPHVWQNESAYDQNHWDFAVKATVIYFPVDFLLNLTDETNIVRPIENLIQRAERGIRFLNETNRKVASILSRMSDTDGFEKIIHFLEVIDILANSREYELLASVIFKNSLDTRDTDRISRVYSFLMKNYHRSIELQEVSNICNMTPNAFCRFFKARTQKSLTRFLNELRIGHACKLLQKGEYSVQDACYESGYNNMTNFNKFFKAITGQTPSQYKKSQILETGDC